MFMCSCGKEQAVNVDEYNALETPCIVPTVYETEDVVIADIIATQEPFCADPTGENDSTEAIRNALNTCAEMGGGTVFLPVGVYKITETIHIPPFVTLRGDWQDPDEGTEYGTIIKACPQPSEDDETGLFLLGGSGGVIGLTVYYPDQWIDAVEDLCFNDGTTPYSFTFYTNGLGANYMLSTIKNVTVLNGYRGIGACCTDGGGAHEQLTVENFKGSFVYCGAEVYNQADVGTWQDVYICPKYWKVIPEDSWMKKPSDVSIDYVMNSTTTGLILGDLEWTEFKNLNVDSCNIGINIVKGKRIEFAGSLYGVTIKNCRKGIIIDSMDDRWGMVIADGLIEGGLTNNTKALVRMTDVEIKGSVRALKYDHSTTLTDFTVEEIKNGKCKFAELNGGDLSEYDIDHRRTYVKPAEILYVFDGSDYNMSDISGVLQEKLNEAATTGGVVYLPAGMYCLSAPISVPQGVELRGSSSVATRDQGGLSSGTVILSYYGSDGTLTAEDTALITLSGENAGLNGLRIAYPENGPYDTDLNTTYAVRGTANNVYINNCAIIASAYGIDFTGCDGHFIKRVMTCCYYNSFKLGGKDGYLSGCLQNGTVLGRNGNPAYKNWLEEVNVFTDLFDPILRKECQYIIVDGADGQKILNTFVYGSANFIVNRNAENTVLINVGSDNIGSETAQTVVDSGSLVGINMMRWNGHSYDLNGGTAKLVNRLTIGEKNEPNITE